MKNNYPIEPDLSHLVPIRDSLIGEVFKSAEYSKLYIKELAALS